MTLKPSDYFINATDFFAVLVPGMVLVWIVYNAAPQTMNVIIDAFYLKDVIDKGDFYKVLILLSSGYVVGHGVRGLTSICDTFFESIMEMWCRNGVGHDEPASLRFWKLNFWKQNTKKLYEKPINRLEEMVKKMKKAYQEIDPEDRMIMRADRKQFNAMRCWCRNYLLLKGDIAYQRLEFFEATSKFFRSMILVALILLIIHGIGVKYILALLDVLLIFIFLYAYGHYRFIHALHSFELTLLSLYLSNEVDQTAEGPPVRTIRR